MEAWIDFGALQRRLDEQGATLGEAQASGAANRKELTAKTKEFRKLDEASRLTELKPLLKLYQNEIDALTARSKQAEAWFMEVYKKLADAPDPNALVAAKTEELAERDVQIAAQAEEIAELRRKVNEQEPSSIDVDTSATAQELEKALMRASQAEARLASLRREMQTRSVEEEEPDVDMAARLSERDHEIAALRAQVRTLSTVSATGEPTTNMPAKEVLAREETEKNTQDKDIEEDNRAVHNEEELVSLRRNWRAAEDTCTNLKQRVAELETDAVAQRELISKLEDDLSSLQGDTISTVSGWTAVQGGNNGGVEITGILAQQRDRYKARAQELEQEHHKTTTQLTALRKELDSAKCENSSLYERVRHLQSPPSGNNGGVYSESSAVHNTLKSLEVDRAVMGMNSVDAALFRLFARAVADRRLRRGICGYIVIVHLVALL